LFNLCYDDSLASEKKNTMTNNMQGPWPRPNLTELQGRYVRVTRLDPAADVAELYDASHRTEEFRALWRYLPKQAFTSQQAMLEWLLSIKDSADPMFYTVSSTELKRKIGMIALMNIVPEHGRAELGNIWYSPLVQKTKVNTEVTYLFLSRLFDKLGYRRMEWKCDNQNEPSKRAALRMGFRYEGLFRKHMVVKGQNRDTAWFSIVDTEWSLIKANFETYLASDGVSLTRLNRPEAS
jgi:RimJ/RimL family protein N-acetyltransferase